MEATCWSDYLCPWCYLGRTRDHIFEERAVTVEHLPFELHPEIPAEGRRIRPGGRLEPTFARIEQACSEEGIPFRRPTRMPNTRRALSSAEWVRVHAPDAFDAVHDGLFAAHFVHGEPLDDPAVIEEVLSAAGVDIAELSDAVESGRAGALVDESMARAREHGIASTPTWVIGSLLIPGALDRSTMQRWVDRIVARGTTTRS